MDNRLPQDRSRRVQLPLHTIVSFNSGNNQRLGNVLVQLIGCFFSSEHSVCEHQRHKVKVL